MYTLILDTSSSYTILALSRNGTLQDSLTYLHQNKLSSLLALSIQDFLKKHDLSPSDLSSIAVGIGPGSYTGTRVGATIAKTLCFALELPLIPFFSCFAYLPAETLGPFIFMYPVKQGAPLCISATATAEGFLSIQSQPINEEVVELAASKKIFTFCIDPEDFAKSHPGFSFTCQKSSSPDNLQKLAQHIFEQERKGAAIAPAELSTLTLSYLHAMNLTPVLTESWTSQGNSARM